MVSHLQRGCDPTKTTLSCAPCQTLLMGPLIYYIIPVFRRRNPGQTRGRTSLPPPPLAILPSYPSPAPAPPLPSLVTDPVPLSHLNSELLPFIWGPPASHLWQCEMQPPGPCLSQNGGAGECRASLLKFETPFPTPLLCCVARLGRLVGTRVCPLH